MKEQLRKRADVFDSLGWPAECQLLLDAIAEIERLETENGKLAKQRDYYHDAWREAQKEVERNPNLDRAESAEIKSHIDPDEIVNKQLDEHWDVVGTRGLWKGGFP